MPKRQHLSLCVLIGWGKFVTKSLGTTKQHGLGSCKLNSMVYTSFVTNVLQGILVFCRPGGWWMQDPNTSEWRGANARKAFRRGKCEASVVRFTQNVNHPFWYNRHVGTTCHLSSGDRHFLTFHNTDDPWSWCWRNQLWPTKTLKFLFQFFFASSDVCHFYQQELNWSQSHPLHSQPQVHRTRRHNLFERQTVLPQC